MAPIKEIIVFDELLQSPVSRHPLLGVAAICAASVMACVALIACDAAAEHHHDAFMSVAASANAAPARHVAMPPAPASAVPSMAGAALREYRHDVDPSHAAIGSYGD